MPATPGHEPPARVPQLSPRRVLRMLLWCGGALALVVGVIGIFLPLLPTTPFILLAAACWARASPRFHRWLLSHPRFGPIIDDWERHRSLPRNAKRAAIGLLTFSMSITIFIVQGMLWLQLLLVAVGLCVALWLWHLPSRERVTAREPAPPADD
jgi:uncharacterized membrane protein YbaN (DUF454 family)